MKKTCPMILRLILQHARMDFRKKNLGTMLGALWAVLSPLTTIGLIFFVFTIGLKSGTVGNISFINWLVPAMLAWFFISESIMYGCTAITDNSYLVTKIVFPVWTLPVSRVIASLPTHLFLLIAFSIILAFQHTGSYITWIQLLYYLLCSFLLCTNISLICATLMVFIRDVANIVGVILQLLFWGTPIFWDPAMLVGTKFQWLLLSPFNYILQGYRDSLFGGIWFWQKTLETFIFWSCVFILSSLSYFIFKRTRPHFADVL